MNLSAYDNTIPRIDKDKTWVEINYKRLVSREIKYRDCFILLHKYNPTRDEYNYYLCVCDNPIDGYTTRYTRKDNYGRIKCNIRTIWDKTSLKTLKHDSNITIKLVDEQDDGEIYELDV